MASADQSKKTKDALADRKWEEVQIQVFTQWVNEFLEPLDLGVAATDTLFADLADGIRLPNFAECLTDQRISKQRWNRKPRNNMQRRENLTIALEHVTEAGGVKLVGVGSADFEEQVQKMVLGFLWTCYKEFRLRRALTEAGEGGATTMEEGLLNWVRTTTEGYDGVDVQNYRSSFRDGLAYLALADKYVADPEKLDFSTFDKGNKVENLQRAFEVANQEMGIPMLLDASEVAEGDVDERTIVLYTSLFFHKFLAKEAEGETEEERRAQEERMAALEAAREARERLADELGAENEELRAQLAELQTKFDTLTGQHGDLTTEHDELKTQHEELGAARDELKENNDVLEEKVRVLQTLLDQETAARDAQAAAADETDAAVQALKRQIEALQAEKAKLEEEKAALEKDKGDLEGNVEMLEGTLEEVREEKVEMGKAHDERSAQELRGLAQMKKSLLEHLEDLHRWQGYLNLDDGGLVDTSGDIRPQVLSEIIDKDFDDQLKDLSAKLDAENGELEKMLDAKRVEQEQQAAKDKAKQARQGKGSSDSAAAAAADDAGAGSSSSSSSGKKKSKH